MMARLVRSIKIILKSRSLQPIWFGSLVVGFIVCHILYDGTKRYKDAQSRTSEEYQDHRSVSQNLRIQVMAGEKAPFVLHEENTEFMKNPAIEKMDFGNPLQFGDRRGRKKLYEYKSFAELPTFSKAVCRQSLKTFIPNIVHYIWFGKWKMTFLHYLSIRSAATIQRPSKIILHTDSGEPEGKYWMSLRSEIPCLEVRRIDPMKLIFGQHELRNPQQMSHIARLKVLHDEGGIYANLNVIFVKPLDPLMQHTIVVGKEENQYYSNSVILAAKGAAFLAMWFSAYNRPVVDWSTYSIYIPYRLHRENPTIDFHVEEYTMMRPNFNEDEWVTDKNWVLDENYCVHLYDQREKIRNIFSSKPLDLINMDNTVGQLTRISLFGKPYLNLEKEQKFRSIVHSAIDIQCASSQVDDGNVPNIIHYVLEDDKFTYKHYLSVRSAARVLKPESIFVYLLRDQEPDSFYWIRTVLETKCITLVAPRETEKVLPDMKKEDLINRRSHVM